MATRKKLVLFVEGEGDKAAAPVLVKRLLTDLNAWSHVSPDLTPLVVGNVADVTRSDCRDWLRWLEAARKRSDLGGVLLLLDGDITPIRKEPFCAAVFGRRLADKAREAGAGKVFSVATVFASMEYESWALACAHRLAGLPFLDGRAGLRAGTTPPEGNLEAAPRDAKKWLDPAIDAGFKAKRAHEPPTRPLVDPLDAVPARNMNSVPR